MYHSLVSSTRVGGVAKRLSVLMLILALCTTGLAPNNARAITPNIFVLATSGDISTLDPAMAYDTASGEVVQNVYETLVFYDGANPNAFVPQLADSYSLSGDGLTWTFHIRPGVTFHNGASLTATDVAYSFQRGLLQGGSSSPQWLLTEPFFGVGIYDVSQLLDPSGSLMDDRAALSAWDPTELAAACEQVRTMIVANDLTGTVTVTLAQPWGPFLATVAQTWGSIVDKGWTIAQGGWDGSCNTWQNWYALNNDENPLTGVANGTGPFALNHWTPGTEIVLTRNNNYWREPAKLEQVNIQIVPDDATRFTMLQTGEADEARPVGDVATADSMVGEDCVWDIPTAQYNCSVVDASNPLRRYIGRPSLAQTHLLMNFDIYTPEGVNPYIGSGQLDGDGIPTDFFSDVHIRKAFNYCFDWDTYGQIVFGGEFVQSTTLVLDGMPGYDLNAPHYTYNLTACETELGLADVDQDGIPSVSDTDDVTQVGFHFQIPYNDGNLSRQTAAEILSINLYQVDPKFVIDAVSLPWPDFLTAQRAGQLPIMTGGWLEDIHDPHNWYVPFLIGTYRSRTHTPDDLNTQFNTLINLGVSVTDFAARHLIYQDLNQLVYDNPPLIILGNITNHSFIQRRVSGRILNPIFMGNYYYTIYIPPVAFNKASPANDTINQPTSLTLRWGASANASKYEYCLYKAGDPVCADDAWTDNSTATTKALTDLMPSTTYYWHVRAVNAGGTTYSNGADTAFWSFTTRPQLKIYSVGTQDGWILESTEISNAGGTMNAAATTFNLGDDTGDKQYRSILSFNTTLPNTAVITKVTLKIRAYGAMVGNNNPFTWGQGLRVDVCKGTFGTSALQLTDFNYFNATNCKLLAGTFGNTPVSGWYSVNLISTAWSKVNKTGLTQFRLRFYKDDNDDGAADYWRFYSGNYTTASLRPTLIIEYYIP
jgi:peptide/nickel transport system substrate-binding protein